MRSSANLASAFKSGFGGSSLASAFGPPLRFSARARMVLNGMVMGKSCGIIFGSIQLATEIAQR